MQQRLFQPLAMALDMGSVPSCFHLERVGTAPLPVLQRSRGAAGQGWRPGQSPQFLLLQELQWLSLSLQEQRGCTQLASMDTAVATLPCPPSLGHGGDALVLLGQTPFPSARLPALSIAPGGPEQCSTSAVTTSLGAGEINYSQELL